MDRYEGCSDGNCILREEPLRVHTNAGCRCLRDIPTQLRLAIQRRIRGQQAEIERLGEELDDWRYGAVQLANEIKQQQAEIERLRAELSEATKTGTPDWHEGEVMSFLVMENQNQQVTITCLREGIKEIVRQSDILDARAIAREFLQKGPTG
jgi:septal ring factor EnvC (AmiA/AmiB activator)